MKTTYFKMIAQKTTADHTVLIAVVPNDFFGKELPSICEMEAFKMPSTIYTGTYPQIKVNTDTVNDITEEYRGAGIGAMITTVGWVVKVKETEDILGIGI